MPRVIHDTQWAAVRALAEGAMPTHRRLADALGVGQPAISHRIAREGWRHLDWRLPNVRAAYRELVRCATPVVESADE